MLHITAKKYFLSINKKVMIFWVLLSAAVSVVLGRDKDVCFGSQRVSIGPIYSYRKAMVVFTPRSQWSKRFVFRNQSVEDPRFQLKNDYLILQEATFEDDGTFTVLSEDGQREYKRVTLRVGECSTTRYLMYGNSFQLEFSEHTAALYFSPEDSPSHSELLWNKTNPGRSKGGRGRGRGGHWVLDKLVHADRGYYTQRTREGTFLSRLKVYVGGKTGDFYLSTGENLYIPLRIPLSEVQVYFSLEAGDPGDQTQLVRDGLILEDGERRMFVEAGELVINEVSWYDSGSFFVMDKEGHLVYTANVNVEAPTYLKYLPLLGLVVVAICCCVCIKKYCCKKRAPPAVPIIYGDEPGSAYPLTPSVPSQPQWSGTPGPSTAGYTSLMDKVSRPTPAAEGGSSIPSYPLIPKAGGKKNTVSSDCLHSSDSGIQFEFGKGGKNKDYFSTLPLNSDAPEISNVYTSDKLNFL
ncbi:hypothetical protein AAFF_G00303010 [Aldrovandia affinis]|uniref:Uncharacterized protein n=1 Tax=Aldrovandia affinis TaxID=143900 RepID=A0AAD7R8R5_9TELE|nr:hypothetical protein AAFF_G00303010 [Aldrovandia affinis]